MAIVRKYLISTSSLKELSLIENNVESDKLSVMINRVQKSQLEPTIGTVLLKKLLQDVDDDTLTGVYETLMNDYIIDFLIVCCELEYVVSGANKMMNMGVAKYSPQDTQQNTIPQNNDVRDNLKKHRNSYRNSLVGFLEDNKEDYPEYADFVCNNENIAPEGKQQEPYFSVVTRKKYV
jgi:large-conductance mechanosensitive channel